MFVVHHHKKDKAYSYPDYDTALHHAMQAVEQSDGTLKLSEADGENIDLLCVTDDDDNED